MYSAPKFSDELVAFLAQSDLQIESIVDGARRLSKGAQFVLVLRPAKGLEQRLVSAYINAVIRHKDGIMRSKSMSLEALLLIAGTMNIGNAVGRASAIKSPFVVFSSSKKLSRQMVARFDMKVLRDYKLRLDLNKSGKIAVLPVSYDK